ncbi:MAG: ATP-binding protein [Candidatus Saccharibacteria bacterium]|nr:ATP-binding protein [Candidatus Saccharibacteria bacterium]
MQPSAPTLIVVQGASAVGKTSLAARLSERYSLGRITKDTLKEMLYDNLGTPEDREQSRVYGSAAMHGLYVISRRLLESNISHIIEAAFRPEKARTDIDTLLRGLDVRCVQVYCHTSPNVQLERYRQRLSNHTRHPGHPDAATKTVEDFEVYNQEYTRLNIERTIDVDTTVLDDDEFNALCAKIDSMIGGE